MFVQRVEIAVRDGRESAFEAALCEVRQQVFMTRGFRDFTVAQGVEEPGTYMVQVLWETADELLEFTGSGRFERCWAPVEPFLARSLRVDHLVERHGLGLQGPGVLTDLV
ncbi:putative quinol monooxygenase [Kineosporia sp. R_H_3]|uniref:putative quinol monooxygenase n=1 Tax=Kineosporia sp. R_H_3 TaxID=1961848 RepID=UPI001304224B|nr:antibiotic biosynthesis monooxygenase family protein [Kineosporia sp. R_H_3]